MAVLLALFMALRVRLLNFLFFSGTDAENSGCFVGLKRSLVYSQNKASLSSEEGFFARKTSLVCKPVLFPCRIIAFFVHNGCVCLAHNVCPLLLVCCGRRDGNHNML